MDEKFGKKASTGKRKIPSRKFPQSKAKIPSRKMRKPDREPEKEPVKPPMPDRPADDQERQGRIEALKDRLKLEKLSDLE